MVERKSKMDDGKGVKEPTNDDYDFMIRHKVLLTTGDDGEELIIRVQIETEKPILESLVLIKKESDIKWSDGLDVNLGNGQDLFNFLRLDLTVHSKTSYIITIFNYASTFKNIKIASLLS